MDDTSDGPGSTEGEERGDAATSLDRPSVSSVPRGTFDYIRPGDTVRRLLAGTIPMDLVVDAVDERLIHCRGGWMFDRETGVEEDPDIRWGFAFGVTGSFLVHRQ